MAFFGRFVARPAIAGRVKVGSVATHAEVPGAMEQDPSPACTAWASPGLPPGPALAVLCLVHFVPLAAGLVLSHQQSRMCALNHNLCVEDEFLSLFFSPWGASTIRGLVVSGVS